MNLKFPEFSLVCHKKIEENGFDAWFVGGCVRDALLGRPFDDIDIATNATPNDIMRIFDKTIPTGVKHGTVTVLIDGQSIEVTTFRSEDGYKDSRHPDLVHFKTDIKEDLSRRDFTINAIAYHPSGKFVDIFDGRTDLEVGLIRCVNDPKTRFSEDSLRILRAFRFASQLSFKIDKDTEVAAVNLIDNLRILSGERILKELKKLVLGNNLYPFNKLISLSAFEFCGINNSKSDISLITKMKNRTEWRFSALLNLCGFDETLLKNVLKIDNKTLNYTLKLRDILKEEIPISKLETKLLLSKYDSDIFELYNEYLSLVLEKENNLQGFYKEIQDNKEPYKLTDLDISGKDILALGFKGLEVGKLMDYLLKKVIENPKTNNKETLISLIKNLKQ